MSNDQNNSVANNAQQHETQQEPNERPGMPGLVREPSGRLLDKDEDEQAPPTLEQKAQELKDKFQKEQKENSVRSDNQEPAQRILDKEDTSEEAGV